MLPGLWVGWLSGFVRWPPTVLEAETEVLTSMRFGGECNGHHRWDVHSFSDTIEDDFTYIIKPPNHSINAIAAKEKVSRAATTSSPSAPARLLLLCLQVPPFHPLAFKEDSVVLSLSRSL